MASTSQPLEAELIYLLLQLAIDHGGEARTQCAHMLSHAETLGLDASWVACLSELRSRLVENRSIVQQSLQLYALYRTHSDPPRDPDRLPCLTLRLARDDR